MDWFLQAVPQYDTVFTPRRANMRDLKDAGCPRVEFLPFAYNPRVHFPDTSAPARAPTSDVMFAGGADADRVPYLAVLIKAGLDVQLYGGYWERYAETRVHWRWSRRPADTAASGQECARLFEPGAARQSR